MWWYNYLMLKIIIALVALAAITGGAILFKQNKKEEPRKEEQTQTPATSGDSVSSGSLVHDLPIEPAAKVARKNLADFLSVDEKDILILEVKDQDWPDSCLGVAAVDEFCAQVITPGFEVIMTVGGKKYVYRADKDGTILRRASVAESDYESK